MKICLINYTPYGTQGSTGIYSLSQSLSRRGEDVTVIGIRGNETVNSKLIRTDNGVSVHLLPIERDVHSKKVASFCISASEIIANQSFDIVHIIAFRGASLIPIADNVKNRENEPTYIYHLTQVSFNETLWKYKLSNGLSRLESKAFDGILSYNQTILSEVLGQSAVSSTSHHVFPIGVDTNQFTRSEKARQRRRSELEIENETLFVSVGSMNKQRKLDYFIRGFSKAIRDTNSQIRLVFIGDGETRCELEMLTRSLGVDDEVDFLGRVPFSEIPEYLSAADIGVSHISPTTPQSIQPPLKVPEYLANGLPVLATSTPGNQVYLEDGVNGFLYSEDSSAIAKAINRAIEGQKWKAMQDACVNSALKFDIDMLADKLISVYGSVQE